jgi:hypothetical protein
LPASWAATSSWRPAVDREHAAEDVVGDDDEVGQWDAKLRVPAAERTAQIRMTRVEDSQPAVIDQDAAGLVRERAERRSRRELERLETPTRCCRIAGQHRHVRWTLGCEHRDLGPRWIIGDELAVRTHDHVENNRSESGRVSTWKIGQTDSPRGNQI